MKALPHNIEAEQALVGSVLLNNEHFGLISATIRPEHFFEPLHAQIFYEAGRLIAAGKKATVVTLKDAFPDVEIAEGVSVTQYLARLMSEGVNSALERDTYVTRVRDLAQMRTMITAVADLERAGADGVAPELALHEAWERLDELRTATRDDTAERGSIAKLAERLLEDDSAAHVVTTGLTDLDKALAGGWRAGRLYILAGRPGMGKTIIALSSSRRVARKGGACSIFSLEIDAGEVVARMAADELARSSFPLPYRDIIARQFNDGQRQHVAGAVERLQALPIRIDATGGLSISEIEARARVDKDRFAKAGHRLAVVMIDYLGLIRATDRYRGRKVDELGEIALGAKTMAKRLDCAVVLLAQLSRGVEARDDKRPVMSDLRDSGNIEEHADFVGLLYRPYYYLERSTSFRDGDPEASERAARQQNQLDLIIGKNRIGPTPIVDLWCDPALSAVDNQRRY